MSAIVLPTLYQTIELKVPLQWTRLPSLENLLASSSEGLKYTRCLKIVANQYRENDAYRNLDSVHETDDEDVVGNEHEPEVEETSEAQSESDDSEEGEDEDSEEEESDGPLFRFCEPDTSASNALNTFIRVLIIKLPRQQLHTFWYTITLPPMACSSLLHNSDLGNQVGPYLFTRSADTFNRGQAPWGLHQRPQY